MVISMHLREACARELPFGLNIMYVHVKGHIVDFLSQVSKKIPGPFLGKLVILHGRPLVDLPKNVKQHRVQR